MFRGMLVVEMDRADHVVVSTDRALIRISALHIQAKIHDGLFDRWHRKGLRVKIEGRSPAPYELDGACSNALMVV